VGVQSWFRHLSAEITRLEESYPAWVSNRGLDTSALREPSWAVAPRCMYSRTPLILINWDSQPTGYAKNLDNLIFFLKVGYIGSFNFGCYCLQYVPASELCDQA